MTFLERWSLHAAAGLTGLSGLIYGWLRYYGQRAGEFGMEAHPLQALLQHLHILGAPLLVFALGMVVRSHVLPRFGSGRNSGRWTGLSVAAGLAPMILSGYAIQIVTEPQSRLLLAWIHGITSLLFLVAYGVHLVRTWVLARRPWAEVVEA